MKLARVALRRPFDWLRTRLAAVGAAFRLGSRSPETAAPPARTAARFPSVRLPHVDFRAAAPGLRLPHVDFRLPHVEVRLPHLEMRLPSMELPFQSVEELSRLMEEPARAAGGKRKWLRYAVSCTTVLALVLGFRALDQGITRWSVASAPEDAWAGEVAQWYQLYADVTETDIEAEESRAQAEQASLLGGTAAKPSANTQDRRTRREGHREGAQRFVRVSVTAYTSAAAQTDDSPTITASNTRVSEKTVAISRDLLREFTPGAPFSYGDKILIPGVGIYRVEDTMNGRWRKKIDLWFASKEDARHWGVRTAYITKVEESTPTIAYRVGEGPATP